MWVNATYPSDGSTYKNEILKCSTSKAEGEEFDIADWKLASKYTDDTKAEEAKKAAEKAQAEIKNTQTNLIALGTTVSNNKKAFDVFTSDGYLDSSEIAAIAQDSKRLEDDYNAAVESYNNVVGSKFLLDKDGKDTTYKTDLVSAKAKLDSAKNELITYLSDIVSRYNASDSNGKATIKAAAAQKYTNFTNAYKAFYDKLGVANNYITSNLFDGLNTKLITNMAGLEYIKAALVDGDTVVKGGLILSTLIALRNDKGNVTAGINGADTKENGIALWLGGKAIDKQASTTTEEEKKIAAKSLLRFDGTGYFANGNLWWDVDGTLHADPTSFIINKNNVGVQLALFAPVWKSGTTDTTKLANVLSIDPQKPFTHLDVSGNVTTEGSLKIGGIYLSYDSANNALRLSKDAAGKEAANFYATGGITAYGAGASTTGGGGGLNGSVKSYSNALKLTSESLSEIASAYSIKALDSRISSLEGGSATAISVSGSGNAVTSVTKNGTTISVVKGSTFLTSHQSLDGYVNAISVSGSGNAITSVSKSGKGITFTKGATFLTSHQSLANYYTKSSVDSLLSGKSATSHTHSVKINGVTKTIAATGGTAVDLGTYLTSHQSLADYAKKSEIPTKVSQLTNDTGYITSSGSCAYATSAGNADKVDGVHVTWAGVLTSTSHLVAWESDGSALRDINPANVSVGNSDKLDGIHANGLLTALSNSDKGISITVGGTTKSISNISVNYASSAGNADTVDGYHATSGRTFDGNINWSCNWNDAWSDGTNKHPWYGFDHRYPNTGAYSTTITDYFGMTIKTANTLRLDFGTLLLNGTDIHNINVASATKLQTPRTIWGQSFDGTGNVDGTLTITDSGSDDPHIISTVSKWFHIVSKYKLVLYAGDYNSSQRDAINILSNHNVGIGVDPSYKLHVAGDIYSSATIRTAAQNRAIVLSNDANPAWISALEGRVIFNTGKAIRFGETAWDWNKWAGLKYTHSNKTIYLGIADGSAFNANSAQSDGTLRLAGIKTITPDSGARIGNSGADLYLGNASNSAWVKVQDICSQANSSLWSIRQDGNAYFKSININSGATFNGPVKVNNMLTARAIMFTTADSNVYGTSLQNWDGTGNVDGTLTITDSGSDDPHIISTVSKWFHIVSKYKLVLYAGDYNSSQRDAINILSNHNVGIGVDPSYKLHVAGDIYSSATIRTAAQNRAIVLSNDANPAWISALEGRVIFNTGKAIRFGETAWDWNKWAGLKYTHSNKTIYLGIADGSAFNANSAQSDGTLRLAGIKTITPDSGARIGNSGADLYLGNASNSAWVKVQDICSQANSSLWSIRQDGNAYFKSININSGATFNGPVKVNNMLTARAIMFTTADSNVYGTSLQNWDGSIGAHVTNMFNGIDSNNISMEYSTNGGSSWLTYTANPNYLFNLINDNSDTENFFLGNNVMSGSSDADKLTQIKKNQLRVTIKIPPEVYQELAWISVDVKNGVDIKCQVYFGNSNGVYTEYVSKVLIGWSHRCDICIGPSNVNVGNDSYRYVRLVFSHLSSHTALRNGIISRIRALALTKYNNGSGRYNISTTGHIYNYDYNMNTYFPNSILAKGGVTAYQSSDIRLKQDLRKLDYLGIIKAMGGTYGFAWKKDNTRSIGWIAQHVLCNPHLKDIVETDEKGYYKINYWSPKLIATAFGAIEQVGDEVSRLKARVVFLESEVQRLSGDKEDCNKKRLDNKNINSLN